MGRITSGVGLVSGINSRDIIDQLMSLESRPKTLLQQRAASVDQQRTAYADISARLTSLRLSATTLKKTITFQNATATSSDENVLTATTSPGAAVGAYTFQVARLVTTQQAVSRGFADVSTAKVGAGTITIETGGGEVSAENLLNDLNGGAGVRRGSFRITDRAGNSAVIDLTSAVSIQDVARKINTTLDVAVRATIDGDRLVLNDQTGKTTSNLVVQDIGDGTTARDLGIVASVAANSITGTDVNALGTLSNLDLLNDGRGVRKASSGNDFTITLTDATVVNVSLTTARTIGDVISAINTAGAGKVTATISDSGNGLKLTDNTGAGAITVASVGSSNAAADLGILGAGSGGVRAGNDVLTELGTVSLRSLNGGAGLTLGSIAIKSRAAGSATNIDLSPAGTVQEAIDLINSANAGVKASVSRSGSGIQIADTSGGTGDLVISEVAAGTTAADLGLVGAFDLSYTAVQGKNLQRQYVGENTLLSSYNGGKGVAPGKFRITDSSGASAVVDLTQGNEVRISDVIAEINSRGIGVTAGINATGDGLLLTDGAGGALKLKVENVDGTTATDLGIEGEAKDAAPTLIDGTLERTITTDANDTLTTLQKKINDLGFGVTAGILNDGTSATPFRLSITARNSGRAGRFVFDSGATKLDAANLVEARDAAVFVGDPSSAEPLLVTSSRNQLANVVRGVNIELTGISDKPVTLSITNSIDNVVEEVTKFTTTFNELSSRITTLTKFDTETNQRGLLLGDGAIQQVQTEIFSMIQRSLPEGGRYRILADVGLRVGSGGELQFDQDKFREAYATDPDAVTTLFTRAAGGLTEGSPLSVLNNGRGVRTATNGAADFRVTARDGTSFEVTLASAFTVGDVVRAINTASAGKVTASVNEAGSALIVTDNTTGSASLTVSPLAGSLAADDLGIKGTTTGGVLTGSEIELPQSRTVGGAGVQIEKSINRLIDPVDGLITRQNKTLESRGDQFRDRISNLDKLLEKKRERLERQFAQLESVLAGLQSQQAALGQIQTIRLPSK